MKNHSDAETGAIIVETLKAVPKPRLSADFSANVMESLERTDRRKAMFRRASFFQSVYGALSLAVSGFIIAGIRWPGWLSVLLLALTPFVFLGLTSSRLILPASARLFRSEPH